MKLSHIIDYLLGFPKTLLFNFKYFPLKIARKLPVLLSKNVFLDITEGSIELPDKITRGMIKIGFGTVGIFDRKRSRAIWRSAGKVIFKGKCHLGHGSKISVGSNGVLEFGEKFSITAESVIACEENITFGDDCLVSWDCLFMDTDYHSIMIDGIRKNPNKPVNIGDNVWVCCRSVILKGTEIPRGCVVAAGSLVSGKFSEESCLLGGNPCRVIGRNISWKG